MSDKSTRITLHLHPKKNALHAEIVQWLVDELGVQEGSKRQFDGAGVLIVSALKAYLNRQAPVSVRDNSPSTLKSVAGSIERESGGVFEGLDF